jgi:hypothetical protein
VPKDGFCRGSYYEGRFRGFLARFQGVDPVVAAAAIGPIRRRGLEGADPPTRPWRPAKPAKTALEAPREGSAGGFAGSPEGSGPGLGRGDPGRPRRAHPWAPDPGGPDRGPETRARKV